MADLVEVIYEYIASNEESELQTLLQSLSETELKSLLEGSEERTTLSYACEQNRANIARLLISVYGMDINKVYKKDGEYTTYLFNAIKSDNIEIVKLLARFGADTRWEDTSGRNALTYACALKKHDIAEILINYGAKVNYLKNFPVCAKSVVSLEGAQYNNTDVIFSDCWGNTVFIQAVREQNYSVLNKLKKLNLDKHHRNNNGSNALDTALWYNDEPMLQYLLNNFFDFKDHIDSLELLGARCILYGQMAHGISYWNTAIHMWKIHGYKKKDTNILFWKHAPNRLNELCGPLDVKKLSNSTDSYLQALNVFLRHVNMANPAIQDAIKKTALASCMDLENSFELLCMLFKYQFYSTDPNKIITTAIKSVCFLCDQYIIYHKSSDLQTRLDLLELLVSFIIENVWGYLEGIGYVDTFMGLYKDLLNSVLLCVDLINTDYPSASEKILMSLKELVKKKLKNYPTSLLHIAIEKGFSFDIFTVLRRCNLIIDSVDENGNYPLHVLIRNPTPNPNLYKIAAFLIGAGSDIDKENAGLIPRNYFLSLTE